MSGSDPITEICFWGAIEEHQFLTECDQIREEKHMEDNWNNNKNEKLLAVWFPSTKFLCRLLADYYYDVFF